MFPTMPTNPLLMAAMHQQFAPPPAFSPQVTPQIAALMQQQQQLPPAPSQAIPFPFNQPQIPGLPPGMMPPQGQGQFPRTAFAGVPAPGMGMQQQQTIPPMNTSLQQLGILGNVGSF
jgi:hypothetical protein